jgi:hypothetical protein
MFIDNLMSSFHCKCMVFFPVSRYSCHAVQRISQYSIVLTSKWTGSLNESPNDAGFSSNFSDFQRQSVASIALSYFPTIASHVWMFSNDSATRSFQSRRINWNCRLREWNNLREQAAIIENLFVSRCDVQHKKSIRNIGFIPEVLQFVHFVLNFLWRAKLPVGGLSVRPRMDTTHITHITVIFMLCGFLWFLGQISSYRVIQKVSILRFW